MREKNKDTSVIQKKILQPLNFFIGAVQQQLKHKLRIKSVLKNRIMKDNIKNTIQNKEYR